MIVAVILLAGIWLTMLIFGTGPLDQRIYEALYAGHRPALAAAARVFTAFGEPTVLITAGLACSLWLWWAGRPKLGLVLFAIMMLGRGLSEIQKYEVHRLRPDLETHLVVVQTSSFPSGHATSSMIFYVGIALALTARSNWHKIAVAGAMLMTFLIGLSRVMLGVHWPSDVIGGWSFGFLWLLLTLRLTKRLLNGDSGPS